MAVRQVEFVGIETTALHPGGEFVMAQTGFQLRIARVLADMRGIEPVEQVELVAHSAGEQMGFQARGQGP